MRETVTLSLNILQEPPGLATLPGLPHLAASGLLAQVGEGLGRLDLLDIAEQVVAASVEFYWS